MSLLISRLSKTVCRYFPRTGKMIDPVGDDMLDDYHSKQCSNIIANSAPISSLISPAGGAVLTLGLRGAAAFSLREPDDAPTRKDPCCPDSR
jgi:hypothetical protein